MAGKDNLKPVRSEAEAREKGRKGGIASGKARREKREFREILETIMQMNVKSGRGVDVDNIKSIAELSGKNVKVKDAIAIAIVQRAAKGDIRAAEWVRDMLGEYVKKVEISGSLDQGAKEMQEYMQGKWQSKDEKKNTST